MRRRLARFGDLAEHASARRPGGRETAGAERAVGDERDLVARAPWQDRVLDAALVEVIEHLIAGDLAGSGDRQRLVELADVEVTDAPAPNLAVAHQSIEGANRVRERKPPRPMEQVRVQSIGA